ncbi:unnamed protein product, partial [Rotaria magnacalcarata]
FNLTLKILVLFEIKNLKYRINLKFKNERNSKFENAITMKQQIENQTSKFEMPIAMRKQSLKSLVMKKRIKNLISQFEITIEVQNSESQSQISIISS